MYWYCLEMIARKVSASNITFELEHDSETIAMEWGLDQLKVQEMMEYMVGLGLFEESAGRITCLKLAFRLDDTNAKNPEIKKIQDTIRTNSEKFGVSPSNSDQIRLDENRLEQSSGRKKRAQPPPSLEDVRQYAKERNSPVDPDRFHEYFETNDWHDAKGNKVKSWKQKFITWESHAQKKDNPDAEVIL